MKNGLILLFIFLTSMVFSQERKFPVELSGSIGVRTFNGLYARILSTALDGDVSISPSPTILLDCDMFIARRFSLGITGYYSNTRMKYVQEDNGTTSVENYAIHQLGIVAKPLLHYGFKEKSNLYSGLRIGQVYSKFVNKKDNISALSIRSLPFIGAQIIPLGYRRRINEQWSYHFELGLGLIHNISFGLAYKLP